MDALKLHTFTFGSFLNYSVYILQSLSFHAQRVLCFLKLIIRLFQKVICFLIVSFEDSENGPTVRGIRIRLLSFSGMVSIHIKNLVLGYDFKYRSLTTVYCI